MIRVVKLKPILGIMFVVFLSFLFCLSFNYLASASKNSTFYKYTIVLDAGHGGIDGGCVGTNSGITEAELNLEVTKNLQDYLENFGFNVVLTRNGKDSLAKEKVADMEKRIDIINKVSPLMVVSIHMNSFSDQSQYGTQVYYENGDDPSQFLAESIQEQMTVHLPNARQNANHGEYYILEHTSAISCIVECGFLSNENDEALLLSEDYRKDLSYSIYSGIVKYLVTSNQITTN